MTLFLPPRKTGVLVIHGCADQLYAICNRKTYTLPLELTDVHEHCYWCEEPNMVRRVVMWCHNESCGGNLGKYVPNRWHFFGCMERKYFPDVFVGPSGSPYGAYRLICGYDEWGRYCPDYDDGYLYFACEETIVFVHPDGRIVLGTDISPYDSGEVLKSPDEDGFLAGESATLTAVPAEGWRFDYWADDAAAYGNENPITVIVDKNMFATAVFKATSNNLEVNSTGDDGDENPNDDKCYTGKYVDGTEECTLRAAIQVSNLRDGQDTITFDIPGEGIPSIQPATPLPEVSDPVVIDGATQQGSGKVELNGAGVGTDGDGLVITAGGSRVKGFVINGFPRNGNRPQNRKCQHR